MAGSGSGSGSGAGGGDGPGGGGAAPTPAGAASLRLRRLCTSNVTPAITAHAMEIKSRAVVWVMTPIARKTIPISTKPTVMSNT